MTALIAWQINTSVVSELMRPRPEPRVEANLDLIASEGLGLASTIVCTNLGVIDHLTRGWLRRFLSVRFLALLGEMFEEKIIDSFLAGA